MLLRDVPLQMWREVESKNRKKSYKTNLKKNILHCNKNRKKGFQGWKKNYTLAAFEKIITPFQNVLITSNWFLNDILSLISFSSTTSGKYSCDFFNCFFLFDLFIFLPFLQVYLTIFFFLRNWFLSLNN